MSDSVEMPRKEVPPPLELVKSRIEEMLPPDAKARVDAGEYALIDTRDAERFGKGHLAGAINVPAGENGVDSHATAFAERIAAARGDKPALLYCGTGNRSARAADALANEHGAAGAVSLVGGIKLWDDLGYPVEGSVELDTEDTEEDED